MWFPSARVLVASTALLLVSEGCSGARKAGVGNGGTASPSARLRSIVQDDDWTMPAWATPAAHSGFYSELAAPELHVDLRALDLTWRQLEPEAGGFSITTTGSAQGLAFASWEDQLALPTPFWVRLFASGVDWAPAGIVEECGVTPIGPDYDGQMHLPIWDPCVWSRLRAMYRTVFIDKGLRNDPRFRFVYVPGAFTWSEFDFTIIAQAVLEQGLTLETFDTWFDGAMDDLVTILDGDNDDPADDFSGRLVFTGEDYPWDGPWGSDDDLYALRAVDTGMGIRNGITEVFNSHLSEMPAWGASIESNGHVSVDEGWALFDGERIVAAENECYDECGFESGDSYYAVVMSNLKILQIRANHLYVVPGPSFMAEYPEHWEWVRLSLGKTVEDTADAWAVLREAEDRYWQDGTGPTWSGKPWLRNWERWLTQRDLPGCTLRRGTDFYDDAVSLTNGQAYEGLRTDRASGDDAMCFDLDDRFAAGRHRFDVKVTFRTTAPARIRLEYAGVTGAHWVEAEAAPDDEWSTATWRLEDAAFDGALVGALDLRLRIVGADLEVRFVRVVALDAP